MSDKQNLRWERIKNMVSYISKALHELIDGLKKMMLSDCVHLFINARIMFTCGIVCIGPHTFNKSTHSFISE